MWPISISCELHPYQMLSYSGVLFSIWKSKVIEPCNVSKEDELRCEPGFQCHENGPLHRRRFLPAGNFQTQMLCLIYCETAVATWWLTFWRFLFTTCCIWKLQHPSEKTLMFSVLVFGFCCWHMKWKTMWCPSERATVPFVFILSDFCFVCAFVLSTLLLTFDVKWLVVGGRRLRHLVPANGHSVIQPGSLSSRPKPPGWGWHTLVSRTLPGRSHEARNTYFNSVDYRVGHSNCWSW